MKAQVISIGILLLALLLVIQPASIDARRAGVLRHKKLVNDGIEPRSNTRTASIEAIEFDKQYVIRLQDNTTDVLSAIQQLVGSVGVTIDYIYNDVFKGAAIGNINDTHFLRVLDETIVTKASRNMKVTAVQQVTTQTNVDWGLDRISPPLDNAYKYKYTGTGVTAFIIDTGIRITHTQFNRRASCGYSAYNDGCVDGNGHGTHVSGIVGGLIAGVAKNVNLVSVKVLGNDGSGSLSAIIAGLDYVTKRKKASPNVPMVLNLSLGSTRSSFVNSALATTINTGVIGVVAAGNSARDACNYSPASLSSAITVGATTSDDTRASYSNYGSCVDVLAPGSYITSTWATSDTATKTLSGTSMATPFVTGIVALQLQQNPSLTPSQVIANIQRDALVGVIRFIRSFSIWNLFFPRPSDKTPNRLVTVNSLIL